MGDNVPFADKAMRDAEDDRRRSDPRRFRFRFGKIKARRVAEREVLLLAAICALDMYTTIYWVGTGHAVEINPILAPTFETHPLAFVALKSALCLPALMLAPLLARRHPRFTVWLLRATVVAYILIYLRFVR